MDFHRLSGHHKSCCPRPGVHHPLLHRGDASPTMRRRLLSLCVALCTAHAALLAGTWHVSPSGNDANDGSAGAPLRTIQTALSRAAAGDTIKVAGGTYTEGLSTSCQVILLGGYTETFDDGLRDFYAYPTTIGGVSATVFLDTHGSTIEGFVLDGPAEIVAIIDVSNGSTVRHNIVLGAGYGSTGIEVNGGAQVVNNTIYAPSFGIRIYSGSGTPSVRNNIILSCGWGVMTDTYTYAVRPYNCYYSCSITYDGTDKTPGIGDITQNPLVLTDFRIRETSPARDAGDPTDPAGAEPVPYSGRIDMGVYGGTKYSPYLPPVPGAPILSSPAHGATHQPLGVTLRWFRTPETSRYHVQLSSDPGFGSEILMDRTDISDSSVVVSGLSLGTTYYWRVSGIVTLGEGPFSSAFTFTTTSGLICVSVSGNDANDGSAGSPLRNIQTALSRAGIGDTIKVMAGSYSEALTTAVPVLLRGGYATDFSEAARDIFLHPSTVVSSSGTVVTDTKGSTIDGLVIDANSGATIGLKLSNNSVARHCIVLNVAWPGHGIEITGGAIAINNTIYGCYYGVYVFSGTGTPNIRNNSIQGSGYAGIYLNAYTEAVHTYNQVYGYSNSFYGNPGVGDLTQDARFRDASNRDFRILESSPCLNAGDPGDPAGDEPAPYSGRIDMGAYGGTKYSPYLPPVPGAPTLSSPAHGAIHQPLTVTLRWFKTSETSRYHVRLSSDPGFSTDVVMDRTDITDSAVTVTGLSLSTTYYWQVSGIVTLGEGPCSAAPAFTTTNGVLCVSTDGSNTNDGTPAAPLRNIQTALTRAVAGDTIKVAAGTYAEALTTQVSVLLLGGYAAGFVDAQRDAFVNRSTVSSSSGVVCTDANGSTIDGFIFDGDNGANPVVKVYNASVVRHCIILYADFYGIQTYGGATIVNNTIYGCYYGVYVFSGTGTPNIRNNSIQGSGYAGIYLNAYTQAVHSYNQAYGYSNGFYPNPGIGDITQNARYRSTTNRDFRILESSPCLNAGDPADSPGSEPVPYNACIDIGVYGGTPYSPYLPPIPPPPVLTSPADGATHQSRSPVLSWSAVPEISLYRLQVSTDPTFLSGVVVDDSTLTDSSCTLSGLSLGTTYYWRVAATVTLGTGVFSAARSFATTDGSLCVSTAGSDVNPGTASAPIRHIQMALSRSVAGDTVKVAGGSYTEGMTTACRVILRGGYTSSFAESSRDIFVNKTIIGGVNATLFSDVNASSLDGFIFDGPTSILSIVRVSNGSTVSHNIIRGAGYGSTGIEVTGGGLVLNNVIWATSYGIAIKSGSGTPAVRNNILYNCPWGMEMSAYTYVVRPYNDIYGSSWAYDGNDTGPGIGDLSAPPQFKDIANGDFRLMGTSLCVDAGDPSDPPGAEPAPYNTRIDMGAYGGTAYSPYLPTPPPAPSLHLPAHRAAYQPLSFRLGWYRSAGAIAYHLRVGTDAALTSGLIIDTATLTDTSYVLGGLQPSTEYYWCVCGRDAYRDGPRSDVRSFTTMGTPDPAAYAADAFTLMLLHMDEPSGTSVLDASVYANHAAATGTTVDAGRFGNARAFQLGDVLTIPQSSTLSPAHITIEAWLHPDSIDVQQYINVYRKESPGEKRFLLAFQEYGTILSFGLTVNGSYAELDVPIAIDDYEHQWVHIAATYDGITKRVYRNGVLVGSQVMAGTIDFTGGDLLIGSSEYIGLIDEMRISSSARIPGELGLQLPPQHVSATSAPGTIVLSWEPGGGRIPPNQYRIYRGNDSTALSLIGTTSATTYSDQGLRIGPTYYFRITTIDSTGFESMPSPLLAAAVFGVVAEYPLDGTAIDASGNGHTATAFNVTPGSDRFGRAGKALSFNGTTSYARAAADSLPTGPRTVSLWFKANRIDNYPTLLGYGGHGDGTSWLMSLSRSGNQCYTLTSLAAEPILTAPFGADPTGTWHHWVIATDGAGTRMYVDGALIGSNGTFVSSTAVSGTDLALGVAVSSAGSSPYTDPATGSFDGALDDVTMFSGALTAGQVDSLYHIGGWPPPAAPEALQVTPDDKAAHLRWNANTEPDFLRYRIYGGPSPHPTTVVDSTQDGLRLDTTRTIAGLVNGQMYSFRVTAVDSAGNESGFSNEMNVVPLVLPVQVTFRVRMNVQMLSGGFRPELGDLVTVPGSFNGWNTSADTLRDADGDSVYSGAITIPPGPIEYKYWKTERNGVAWEAENLEQPGASNRRLTIPKADTSAPLVWFNNDSVYTPITTPVPVTFRVRMNIRMREGAFRPDLGDIVKVMGSFNGWTTSTDTLRDADGDSVYTGVFPIVPGLIQYKYWKTDRSGTSWERNDLEVDWTNNRVLVVPSHDLLSPLVFFDNDSLFLGLPDAPTSLHVSAASSTSLTVTWVDQSDNEDGFLVFRSLNATESFIQVRVVGRDSTSFRDENLSPNTTYFYFMAAINRTGRSPSTPVASGTTFKSPPAAPAFVSSTPISTTRIDLMWTDNASNEDGFRLERKTGAGGTYTQIADLPANTVQYQSTGLTPSTTYYFRLVAYNNGGASASTETNTTTLAPDLIPPASPVSATISPAGWTSNPVSTISWTNPTEPSGIKRAWYRVNAEPTVAEPGTPMPAASRSFQLTWTTPGTYDVHFYLEDSAGNKDPTTCACLTARFDNGSPVIQHDSTAVASFTTSAPQPVSIQATGSDPMSGLRTLALEYRRAGTSWSAASSASYPAGGGTIQIPAAFLTSVASSGVDYRVTASDSAGNTAATPTHSIFIRLSTPTNRTDSLGNQVPQPSVDALAAGTSAEMAYRLFSVPLTLDTRTPQDVFEVQTELGPYTRKSWRLFKLNSDDSYAEYPDFSTLAVIEPGKAFFLIVKTGVVIKTGPGTVVKAEDLNKEGLSLRSGYNFVGNPFSFNVPIASLRLADGTSLSNITWEWAGVGGTNGGWKPNPLTLKAWEGIVIRTTSATTLRFEVADRPLTSLHPSAPLVRTAPGTTQERWQLRLLAQRVDNGVRDIENIVGVEPGASDLQDPLDLCEPPLFGEQTLSLSFPSGSGEMTHDLRPPGNDGYVWDFRIRTPDSHVDVRLSVLDTASTRRSGFLLDLDSRVAFRLESLEPMIVDSRQGVRHYRLIVGSVAFAEAHSDHIDLLPTRTFLAPPYPNPFNPFTTIRYSLAAPGKVRLEVVDLVGRVVRVLVDREALQGYWEVRFDGRGFASGIYFARLITDRGQWVQKLLFVK